MHHIARQNTALKRHCYSKPINSAINDGLISCEKTVFDYGCGLGDDVDRLKKSGIQAGGWDPSHKTRTKPGLADIVNLGYVINVIEDYAERQETLKKAWSLTKEILIVSAQLTIDAKTKNAKPYNDGFVTNRGTFQKYFGQQELKKWISGTLGETAVAAAPGVFYVFRDQGTKEAYLSSRYRRRAAVPRQRKADVLFEEHRESLGALMEFYAERGRIPGPTEISSAKYLTEIFGTIKNAFRVIKMVTDPDQWERIVVDRSQDLLLYLALARFDGRPKFSGLPSGLQLDVKAFFSNYRRACELADALLFGCGDQAMINSCCADSGVGKLTPSALYVHVSAISELPPLLRAYEGCARSYAGVVYGANIIKLHRRGPKISYLSYPGFEKLPHPPLAKSFSVNLQTFKIRQNLYDESSNPPILHRKELFVTENFAGRKKFVRLTEAEKRAGLYEETSTIGRFDEWNEVLIKKGVYLKGHRLLKKNSL